MITTTVNTRLIWCLIWFRLVPCFGHFFDFVLQFFTMQPHVLFVNMSKNLRNVCNEKILDKKSGWNKTNAEKYTCIKCVTQKHWIHIDTNNCTSRHFVSCVLRSSFVFFFHFPNGIYINTCVEHNSSCHDLKILSFFIVNYKINSLSNCVFSIFFSFRLFFVFIALNQRFFGGFDSKKIPMINIAHKFHFYRINVRDRE